MCGFAEGNQRAGAHECITMTEKNPKKNRRRSRKLRLKEIEKVMTKEEMEAYAAACRVQHGTAQPEDFKVIRRYEETLPTLRTADSPPAASSKSETLLKPENQGK